VVSLTGYAFTSTDDYGTVHLDVGDDCVEQRIESTDPSLDDEADGPYCRDDAIADGTPSWAWDSAYGAEYATVQRDGRWYLSPARSVATTWLTGARAVPDGGLTPELVEQGAAVSLLVRAYNLVPGPFAGMGWMFGPGVSIGESCWSSTDSDGNTVEECSGDGSVEVTGEGTPIDPETGVEMTATTVAVPTTTHETVVEGVGTPIDPGAVSPTTLGEPASPTLPPSDPTTTSPGAVGGPNG
jgi:hypothetical protein